MNKGINYISIRKNNRIKLIKIKDVTLGIHLFLRYYKYIYNIIYLYIDIIFFKQIFQNK